VENKGYVTWQNDSHRTIVFVVSGLAVVLKNSDLIPPSVPIPQDVIRGIINHLHHDIDNPTLKCCVVVSRSFRTESRPQLFSTIRLESPFATKQLHTLLTQSPEITDFIRKLFICCDNRLRRASNWPENNPIFPFILKLVRRPQVVSLRNLYGSNKSWDRFSLEAQTAFIDIFRAPTLRAVELYRISGLPTSIMGSFQHLTTLSLSNVMFQVGGSLEVVDFNSSPQFSFSSLDVLELGIGTMIFQYTDPPTTIFAQMRSVQILSIWYSSEETWSLAKTVIRSSADSIRAIMWNCCEPKGLVGPQSMFQVSLRNTSIHPIFIYIFIRTPSRTHSQFAMPLLHHQFV
jgi:hypothetical protein